MITPCTSVSFVNFEHVIAGWVSTLITKWHSKLRGKKPNLWILKTNYVIWIAIAWFCIAIVNFNCKEKIISW